MHDVIGCYLNLDNFTIKFSKNGMLLYLGFFFLSFLIFTSVHKLNNFQFSGVDLGEAFKIADNLRRSAFFPAVVLKVIFLFNFSDRV